MTQEDKELLLVDLCARSPYGVKCRDFTWDDNDDIVNTIETLECIYPVRMKYKYKDIYGEHEIERIKPYLRPMSSMTDEEVAIFNNILNKDRGFEEDGDGWIRCDSIHTKWGVCPDGCTKLLDYLNSIHIDYRGLIEKDLALEAPDGMYEINKE